MKPIAACAATLVLALVAAAAEPALPWQAPFGGADETGPNVIALWHFDAGAELRDASGHGHDLVLRGQAHVVADGRFGGSLESFLGGAQNDKPQGAAARNAPDLSPAGAFTVDLWLRPKPELADVASLFLVDKKYYNYAKDLPQANWDYCLCLTREGAKRRLQAHLGFGQDSASGQSQPFDLPMAEWTHLAVTYDGAGTLRFFVNGQPTGRAVLAGRGPITPGRYDLVVGDRFGSTHTGCPAFLDEVRVSNGIPAAYRGSLDVSSAGRLAFRRLEDGARLHLRVTNDSGAPVTGLRVSVAGLGEVPPAAGPDLAVNGSHELDVPLDTRLRPDTYPVTVTATARGLERELRTGARFDVTIVARPLPDRLPVVMWGTGDLPRLQQIGFTHQLVHPVDYRRIWDAGAPTDAVAPDSRETWTRTLDEYLAKGVGAVAVLQPGRWLEGQKDLGPTYARIGRDGKPYGTDKANACVSFAEVQAFGRNVGASVVRAFGACPALAAALVHSEVRDSTALCFHEHDRQACREATGHDIPVEVTGKSGRRYSSLPGFSADRIVPDDDPLLAFYRWFWKDGDGWNPLHTAVSDGLKSTGRRDLWTFFDPAVRVPSLWGSGGNVDVISQWTYSYPDPIKIGQATDELFAMAAGNPAQQVMKMTQIIWYRSGTAPELPADESRRVQWEKDIPDARFITISPDHLREAFWCMVSRPVRGIMYHGWGSLVEADHAGYRFTHPGTAPALAELIRDVVTPLGPTLLNVPDREADVLLLESFASQVFAGRGTYGWSGKWEADMHLILQWAHLQPRIVYDQSVVRDGLGSAKVLVLPGCDVLTAPVAERIREFQRRGGIVVADEFLAPGLFPDVLVPSYARTGKADQDKAELQVRAARLAAELDPFYTRYASAAEADAIVRVRTCKQADYLFVINDKRQFGDYVGHHGKVMETGVPLSTTVTLRRPGVRVYDLVAHRALSASPAGADVTFPVELGPGEGRVFLAVEEPVTGVRVTAPTVARRGDATPIGIQVMGEGGRPLPAVVPIEVTIHDPEGRAAEGTGHYAAVDGRRTLTLDLAPNDLPGEWSVEARELASGQGQRVVFRVEP